jgi:hypothetical protein
MSSLHTGGGGEGGASGIHAAFAACAADLAQSNEKGEKAADVDVDETKAYPMAMLRQRVTETIAQIHKYNAKIERGEIIADIISEAITSALNEQQGESALKCRV